MADATELIERMGVASRHRSSSLAAAALVAGSLLALAATFSDRILLATGSMVPVVWGYSRLKNAKSITTLAMEELQ